jgi:hypothetical protein
MAFARGEKQDDEEAPITPSVSGGGMAPGQPTPPGRAGSGKFWNIGKFLDLNKGKGEQMVNKAVAPEEQLLNDIPQDVTKAAEAYQNQINAGTLGKKPTFVAFAAEHPVNAETEYNNVRSDAPTFEDYSKDLLEESKKRFTAGKEKIDTLKKPRGFAGVFQNKYDAGLAQVSQGDKLSDLSKKFGNWDAIVGPAIQTGKSRSTVTKQPETYNPQTPMPGMVQTPEFGRDVPQSDATPDFFSLYPQVGTPTAPPDGRVYNPDGTWYIP